MTDKTINTLTATTTAVGTDEIPMWVAGSGVTRKITRANFLAGYGALATANSWTAAQTVVGAAVGARVAASGKGGAVRHVGALVANTFALANGAALTISFDGDALLFALTASYAALFFAEYVSATISELADPSGIVPAFFTVAKAANSRTITITNVSGVGRDVGVLALGAITAVS